MSRANQDSGYSYNGTSGGSKRRTKMPSPPPEVSWPQRPVSVKDFEVLASRSMQKNAFDYMAAGAMEGQSTTDNRLAFKRSVP